MITKNFNYFKLRSELSKKGISCSLKKNKDDIQGINFNKLKRLKLYNLDISEHSEMNIYKGSENLYFDLNVYLNFDEYFLSIYTKDNHKELKELIQQIIEII